MELGILNYIFNEQQIHDDELVVECEFGTATRNTFTCLSPCLPLEMEVMIFLIFFLVYLSN